MSIRTASWLLGAGLAGGLALPAPAQEGMKVETVSIPGTRIKYEMVSLPGGKFRMGSPPEEKGRDNDEGPVREVELRPFWMGKCEVSWAEFDEYFGTPKEKRADGVTHPTTGRQYLGMTGLKDHFQEGGRAAVCLRWHSAMGYAHFLSRKTGHLYRLPTEAEWEYACRAGSDKPAPEPLGDYAWFGDNSDARNHEVGKKKPNAFGLHDMLGNVWEYCLEPYSPPDHGPVLRGGAWNSGAGALRAANRHEVPEGWFGGDPNLPRSIWWLTDNHSQGFRLVRVADASTAGDREAYAGDIQVTVRKEKERIVKFKDCVERYMRVSGEVRNAGRRTLDEVHVLVYFLTPKGKPHLAEVTGADKPGRATFTYVFPALVNSAHPGAHRQPMKPGEARPFVADVPMSDDGPDEVDPDKFGGHAIGVVFN